MKRIVSATAVVLAGRANRRARARRFDTGLMPVDSALFDKEPGDLLCASVPDAGKEIRSLADHLDDLQANWTNERPSGPVPQRCEFES